MDGTIGSEMDIRTRDDGEGVLIIQKYKCLNNYIYDRNKVLELYPTGQNVGHLLCINRKNS
jgi:hypothetical protein